VKRAAAFVVPFVLVTGGILGFFWWTAEPPLQRQAVIEFDAVSDLDLEQPFVRIEAMAHYPVVVKQKTNPRFPWQHRELFYVFPLFDKHDPDARAVRILVRTKREPERFVAYEYMTVEGRLERPTAETLPYNTEIEFGKRSEYFFTDDLMILEPWQIEHEDGIWTVEEAEAAAIE
jgi:hypothetical protein